ncbi:trans-aconitate 2-methyltransferase [Allosaccharopolyspora coralli]|uniref:Trans-aconitate 2-methyltransferase n=1 Tax=Allosaccharopolyspora coralli TaxID=2665642 RepID=A0A5Q3Q4P6_9PSEU|nr:trans-aconitate 2-methyltransferase [Allosaccharopolyspora coralli]QGK69303.1 trans-aconitate 2-methyltransferase [Allosaccharopolyspora coralli]
MWDAERYLAFSDHRSRPAQDLLARVGASEVRRAVDLGCGAGNLTELLSRRWPRATIEASDSSEEMVAAARERGVDARVQDVRDWMPQPDTDVVLCNAVLQWVPDHVELLRKWMRSLPAGAWFALQVPDNFDAPSHTLAYELATESPWPEQVAAALRECSPVASVDEYADALLDEGCEVDAWRTTYLHLLDGPDPVLNWMSGTALRPVRAVFSDVEWDRFQATLAPRLRSAYPARPDGRTWFPFARTFVLARRPD